MTIDLNQLRAIIWENRESHDTRQKIEFFFYFAKTSFLVTLFKEK